MHRAITCIFLLVAVVGSGQDSFQQTVDYTINVRLNDVGHELDGSIDIRYGNNSPDVIDTIWLHLWPNAYKDRFTSLCSQHVAMNEFNLHFAKEEDLGRLGISDLLADGKIAEWGYHHEMADIGWVKLNRPLQTSDEVMLQCNFNVKIPSGEISRLGHVGQSYQITQWYPKPAVYNSNGWNIMPYLSLGEFFSEFGTFDVSITLPENYVVGATGELSTVDEITWLDSLAQIEIGIDGSNDFPPSSDKSKTIRYRQDNVHDFAWFADKRYLVRKGSVTLPRSKRDVSTWTMFTPENAETWDNSIDFVNASLLTYSYWVGDYPYAHVTAVDGTISAGGGMEYPMITVIGNAGNPYELDIVISHEVGHNWFYGILANDERSHPWMDEGLNSFMEMVHIGSRYAGVFGDGFGAELVFGDSAQEAEQGYRYRNELGYLFQARRGKDQPLNGHSESFTPTNYGVMVYSKTALVFDMLLAYLGTERFIKCLTKYYDTWAFNHPSPQDIRQIFEDVSGEDLSWCFEGFIKTDRKFDPRAISLRNGEFEYEVKGGILAPFPVTAWLEDKLVGTTWVRPGQVNGTTTLPWQNVDRVRIDYPQRTLDVDRTNNEVRRNGIFKRSNRPSFKYLFGVDRADREQIFWTPFGSVNVADGAMLGLAFLNTGAPSKQTEIVVTPLYGVSSKNVVGAFRVMQNFDRSRSWARGLEISLTGRRSGIIKTDDVEALYSKLSISASQELNPNRIKKAVTSDISFRTIWIEEQSKVIGESVTKEFVDDALYHELKLSSRRNSGVNPFGGEVNFLYHENGFFRGHVDFTFNAVLNKDKDKLSLRFYGGKFFSTDALDSRAAFRTAGQSGDQDFLYDGLFAGRYERAGVWPQQFMKTMGGFKTPTSQGASDDYVLSLNMEMDLPFVIPLAVFASAANAPFIKVDQSGVSTDNRTLFEAGIGLRLIRNIFEVWMPLTYSEEIRDEFEFTNTPFEERIRFTLDLTKIDPTKAIRSIAP